MSVFITGIAGTLGSSLVRLLLDEGYLVKGNDITRIDDAWKLEGYKDKVEYLWKSTCDIKAEDIGDSELIFDCGLEFADRPLGISSPTHTLIGNLLPPLKLLETVRGMREKPIIIYPSSFNALYGNPVGSCYTEQTAINPSSQYGWSKGCAELLYTTYSKAHNLPIIITRVGSAYGERMRSDELVMKLIINCTRSQTFKMRSPYAKRLWTYGGDVMTFYSKLLENVWKYQGETLCCAGNLGDRIIVNMRMAELVSEAVGIPWKHLTEGEYEAGEKVDGKPIGFTIDSGYTRRLLKWEPEYSLEEGLKKTVKWYNNYKK